MFKLRRLLANKQDINEVKQDIENIPETLIEDIILEEQKELGKVRKTTTSYLRSKYGSAVVDRTLRRLDKRRQRGQEPEEAEENETFSVNDLVNLLKSGTKKQDSL